MENVSLDNVGGSVYDAAWGITDAKFLEGRRPHLGSVKKFRDGREFVLCSSDVDHAAGGMVGAAQIVAQMDNIMTLASAGATSVILNITGKTLVLGGISTAAASIVANDLAGMIMSVVGGTGIGYSYKIKSNTAYAVGYVTCTLYDGLVVATSAASPDADIVLTYPLYDHAIVNTATTVPIGAAVVAVNATSPAMQFFWVQTKGSCCLLGTGTIGMPLDCAAAGAVAVAAASTTNSIGTCMATGAASGVVGYLRL